MNDHFNVSLQLSYKRSSHTHLGGFVEPGNFESSSEEEPYPQQQAYHRQSIGMDDQMDVETPRRTYGEEDRGGRRTLSGTTDNIRGENQDISTDDESADSEMVGPYEVEETEKVYKYKAKYGRPADQYEDQDPSSTTSTGEQDQSSTSPGVAEKDKAKQDDKNSSYFAVKKYDVDYTNQNYMRSKCNKPAGLHRYTLGRQFDWDVEYDNSHHLQSKVIPPKGMHRLKKDVKRQRVPDNDFLADSSGWEFEYGPEFMQTEGDAPYKPDERIVARAGYRYYGVCRNNSDADLKEDDRDETMKIVENDYKYGPEFLQDDVQHVVEQKDCRVGRGGYRYYDTDRSVCDRRPCDMMGIDYRESRASLGLPSEESEAEKERLAKYYNYSLFVLSEEALQADGAEEDLEVDEATLRRDAHLQEGLGGGGQEEEEAQGGEARHQDRSGSKSCFPLLGFFLSITW
ncbi:uncharacterized protein CDAR_117791 [Caerostris darwini]|uniref:Uncharacterized protein n=1 Tax=Caerostris darwini TaxID=1538125 RepID=A0AAV4Q2K6_9ARAC|nr:uncharacterized protein CDAR_117791 [Caerostris darwini]